MVGFDFTAHVRRLCADMISRLNALRHIDLDRVAFRFCQTRRSGQYGIQASLTPLRFAGGQLETQKRGRRFRVAKICDDDGREMLYLLSFYLPRFLDRPFEDKLNTILHELWHINPEFNGDIRRHEGRCYAHTSSQKRYESVIKHLTSRWLALDPPDELFAFLRLSFRELTRAYGPVYGKRIYTPRFVAVVAANASAQTS
jgi:predicted metallopeptidase